MKKLILLASFVVLSFARGAYPDFSMCYKKFKNYSTVPISKNYSVTSQKPKNFVKYDPKLNLYLIKTHNKKYLHFKQTHLGVWIASISANSIYVGNYAKYQTSLYAPAQISTKTTVGSIISDIFCNPIGIGVKGGFLSKSYIRKFITSKPPKIDINYLKTAGIIYDKNLIITKILPNSPASKHYIQTGSKIVKINNQKVYTPNDIKNALKKAKTTTITLFVNGFYFTFKGD
jgi:hypothetical protein